LADEPFNFAPEEKEHVHFNREPEQRITIWRMDERVSQKPPDLSLPNLRAIEHEIIQDAVVKETDDQGGQDRAQDMESHQDCGDVDRVTSHPRYRPIIIGGSHSEHISNKQPALRMRKVDRLSRPPANALLSSFIDKKLLENRANRKKFTLSSD
jgi:hypothetical protein